MERPIFHLRWERKALYIKPPQKTTIDNNN